MANCSVKMFKCHAGDVDANYIQGNGYFLHTSVAFQQYCQTQPSTSNWKMAIESGNSKINQTEPKAEFIVFDPSVTSVTTMKAAP